MKKVEEIDYRGEGGRCKWENNFKKGIKEIEWGRELDPTVSEQGRTGPVLGAVMNF